MIYDIPILWMELLNHSKPPHGCGPSFQPRKMIAFHLEICLKLGADRTEARQLLVGWQCFFMGNLRLVGGFNPSAKYESVRNTVLNIWNNIQCCKPPTRICGEDMEHYGTYQYYIHKTLIVEY